jgi:ABC-2 type transport system permease protein
MRNSLLVALNTLRVTFKARSRLLVYLVMPVLGVVLSLFINLGGLGHPARVGVVDLDGGTFAADLAAAMNEWGGCSAAPAQAAELDGLIAKGTLDAGIVIPAGYGEGLLGGAAPNILLVSLKGAEVTAWLGQLVGLFSDSVSKLAEAAGGDRAKFLSMYEDLRQTGSLLSVENCADLSTPKRVTVSSLGFLVFFIMLGAVITMNLSLTERRNRTYSRIRCAPRTISWATDWRGWRSS